MPEKIIQNSRALWLLLLIFPMTGALAQPIGDLNEAINQAGRQRMLGQRIVKDYLLIGQNLKVNAARKQLQASIDLYQHQHDNIKAFSSNPLVSYTLKEIDPVWSKFKALASSKPEKSQAIQLNKLGEQLLDLNQLLVISMRDEANTEQAKMVNMAGRQRMLSQRLAKAYLMLNWNIADARCKRSLNSIQSEFSNALQQLSTSELNTPEITRALQKVSSHWKMLELSLGDLEGGKRAPLAVANGSDRILKEMNRITGMYAAL
ncbi:MAG: type IV pili methyl-accepting chemotaxis transducer N-terminal domain-containing protein [gamma proteobacterium symbiont of Bathyaustriella thionipta]|nr:type IV pili methyl-accepting chemotaxis transducer N-terminal domain-containing protein [gamma proteobacterium symbiont of Bathyaustriella thionipta]